MKRTVRTYRFKVVTATKKATVKKIVVDSYGVEHAIQDEIEVPSEFTEDSMEFDSEHTMAALTSLTEDHMKAKASEKHKGKPIHGVEIKDETYYQCAKCGHKEKP